METIKKVTEIIPILRKDRSGDRGDTSRRTEEEEEEGGEVMNENKRRGGRVSHGGTRTWKHGGIHPRKVSGSVHGTLDIHVDPVTGGYAPICNHP